MHAEHAETGIRDGGIQAGRQGQRQDVTGLRGIDHTVVPQAAGSVIGVALPLVLFADRCLEGGFVFRAPVISQLVALDGGQHAGGLFAPHDRNTAVGPHPQKARIEGAAAHAVVAGPEAAADQDGELGYLGAGHGGDELGAILGNAAVFVFLADHEAGDVLQEHQRNLALAA